MALRPDSVVNGGSVETQRLQSRWNEFVSSNPMASGNLVENVTLAADGETTRVSHGLNRPYRGFMVVRHKLTGAEWVSATSPLSSHNGGTAFTGDHELGGMPTYVRFFHQATATDAGYSSGDRIYFEHYLPTANNTAEGWMTQVDATSYRAQMATNGYYILHKTTRARTTQTGGSWNIGFDLGRKRKVTEVTNQETSTSPSTYIYLQGLGFNGSDKVDLWVF